MRQHLLFTVPKKLKTQALLFLTNLSDQPLYEIEENNQCFIGGFFSAEIDSLPDFLNNFSILDDTIDWQNQWEAFSPNMTDGLFELDLAPYGTSKKILLKPGPGFGDLSHPTTNLCLEAMQKLCFGSNVIDYGCGSGILSVAAYAFGAYQVFSLEIDQSSIFHAKENLKLNQFRDDLVLEQMPQLPLEGKTICIINMTFGEQKIALKTLELLPKNTEFLSSGILHTQQQDYKKWGHKLGIDFKLIQTKEKWALFYGKKITN